MNELILKFTGEVSENTFPSYKKDALSFVKKADFPIVTNEDFSDSVKNVKKCKEIEEAITSAKEKSFADMEQINKIFEDLGEVFGIVRAFRLKREKDIAKETERKRIKMVADGFAIVSKSFDSASESNPLILNVISINDNPMRLAIKGKRTEESGKKSIAESVKVELSRIESAIKLTVENEKIITSSGYPDLFPDLKGIIGKSTGEIELLVSGRVATHQLAEKERKEKEETASKAEEERKTKAAKDEAQKEKETPAPQEPTSQEQATKNHVTDTNIGDITKDYPAVEKESEANYIISVKMTCTAEQAKDMAKSISKSSAVTKVKLSMG